MVGLYHFAVRPEAVQVAPVRAAETPAYTVEPLPAHPATGILAQWMTHPEEDARPDVPVWLITVKDTGVEVYETRWLGERTFGHLLDAAEITALGVREPRIAVVLRDADAVWTEWLARQGIGGGL